MEFDNNVRSYQWNYLDLPSIEFVMLTSFNLLIGYLSKNQYLNLIWLNLDCIATLEVGLSAAGNGATDAANGASYWPAA